MRKALILTMGLAVVLSWATSGAAHDRVFFSAGFGVPVHPGFVTVLPSGFVSRTGFVITPQTIIRPRAPVIVTTVPARFFPQAIVVTPPARAASPVFVTAPPAVIVLTSQTSIGPRTVGRLRR